MYKPEKFWNRFARRYNKSPVANESNYQEKLKRTRTYFTPESTVLEFGCGTGTTAVSHAGLVNRIIALDVSEKMLEFGRDKARAANVDNIKFICGDIDGFSITDTEFDVVLGLSILHLLDDKEAVIKQVFELLKPGGVFISSTVVMRKKRPIIAAVLGLGKALDLLPLIRFFSAQDLEKSLTDQGFEIDDYWHPDGADSVFIVAKKPV